MQVEINFWISVLDLGAFCSQMAFDGILFMQELHCKSYNTVPTGSVITIKMYANGCLKSHSLLFLSYLKHHELETA